MSAIEDLLKDYVAGPKLLRDALVGMSAMHLQARPIPGKWSAAEVVCHIADFDPIYVDRMKRVIAEDRPTLLGADENRFAAALAYDQRDIEEELRIIELTRSHMAKILATLPDEALDRVGIHNERGEMTLRKLLVGVTQHLTHHLAFIPAKRKALGLAD